MFRASLVAVRGLYELAFGPRRADEAQADRQAARHPHRDRDRRIARDGRGRRARAEIRVAVDVIREPCRRAGRRDDRIELMLGHRLVDAFAREPPRLLHRIEIRLLREGPLGLRADEKILPEVRHLALLVLLVERDQVPDHLAPSVVHEYSGPVACDHVVRDGVVLHVLESDPVTACAAVVLNPVPLDSYPPAVHQKGADRVVGQSVVRHPGVVAVHEVDAIAAAMDDVVSDRQVL